MLLEFKVKKEGWGGGGTRQVIFTQIVYGNKEILKPNGKALNVWIGPGLPSTTKPNVQRTNVHQHQKYPSSTPKMPANRPTRPAPRPANTERIQNSHKTVSNDQTIASKPSVATERPTLHMPRPTRPTPITRSIVPTTEVQKKANTAKQPNKIESNLPLMGMFTNPKGTARGYLRFPPPLTKPPPPGTPTLSPAFKLPPLNTASNGAACNKEMQTGNEWNTKSVLKKPPRATSITKPPPQKPAVPSLPKGEALYDYNPQDLDELELKEGDIVEILKENEGGWWQGRLKGKTGLFPANYIKKL